VAGRAARPRPPPRPPRDTAPADDLAQFLRGLVEPEAFPCTVCGEVAPVVDLDGGDGWVLVVCTSCDQVRSAWALD
jgi:hypothetical protein